jgi:hypothetical protein
MGLKITAMENLTVFCKHVHRVLFLFAYSRKPFDTRSCIFLPRPWTMFAKFARYLYVSLMLLFAWTTNHCTKGYHYIPYLGDKSR